MTHTEKYELPIIEGTDVIDYEPFNEGMEKIENALDESDIKVQEAVDDVAEMDDTLNQKVQEVNEALEQTEENVNIALQETTDELNEQVDGKLGKMSVFNIVRSYNVPDDTYYFGSENGSILFPLTELSPSISRIEGVPTPQNNRFYIQPTTQYSNPISKITFKCLIKPLEEEDTFNKNTIVRVRIDRKSQGSVGYTLIDETYVNTSIVGTSSGTPPMHAETPIYLSCLASANAGDTFRIEFSSNYSHKIHGIASLTVENVGMNN